MIYSGTLTTHTTIQSHRDYTDSPIHAHRYTLIALTLTQTHRCERICTLTPVCAVTHSHKAIHLLLHTHTDVHVLTCHPLHSHMEPPCSLPHTQAHHTLCQAHTHTHSDTRPHTQAHSPLTGDRCQKQCPGSSRGPVGHRRDRQDSFPDSRAGPLERGSQEEETPRGQHQGPVSVVSSPPRGRSWNRIELGAG